MYYDRLSDLGIKLTRRSGQEKTRCPQCSDGRKNKNDKPLSVNINTGEYKCHHCSWGGNVRAFERKRDPLKVYEKPDVSILKNVELREQVVSWFKQRGISESTLGRFLIFCRKEYMPQTSAQENCICFPYYRDGQLINVKYRDGRKNFKLVKGAELIFFNLPSISNRKSVIITEGEIDCMAMYEAGFGVDPIGDDEGTVLNDNFSKWGIVSVPNGASKGNQKMEYLDNCSEFFEGMDEIVIATDGDEAGVLLKDELIRRLGVERCRVVTYPYEEVVPLQNGLKRRCKDMNEVLLYLGKEVVATCIENSASIPVDGVHFLEDIFPSMLENFKKGIVLAPKTHFGEMDDYFRWKKGEINMFTGYANHGKTTLVLQMMLTKSVEDGWKWAIFSPENYPANDFYDDLVEMYTGKWLDSMSQDDYVEACYFIDKHIFYVYPEDSHDINAINEKFRYLVLKKGIDGCLIDPINQLDHNQKAYQREDQYLSEMYKDIKRFSLLNNISYNIIAHPVKPQREADKSYPPVDSYDISGGSMNGNKMDNIVSYYRPNFHIDKSSPEVQIYVQKVKRKRTGGKSGDFPIRLNWATKRFVDPITNEPFCNPQREKIRAATQIPQTFDFIRKPYLDSDEDIDNNDLKF